MTYLGPNRNSFPRETTLKGFTFFLTNGRSPFERPYLSIGEKFAETGMKILLNEELNKILKCNMMFARKGTYLNTKMAVKFVI